MNNSKSNFNQALWLGVSSVSSMLVSILSAAILSRFFDKAEYGTYKQILFVYTTLLVIFEAGLPGVFSYFLPKYSHEEGKYIVKRINTVLFILGFFLSATIYLTSGFVADYLSNPELEKGLKLFSPFPIFTLPTIGLEGIYVVNRNTMFVAIYNTVTRLLMLLCIVLPVVFIRNSYETAVIGWGVSSILAFVFAMFFITRPYKDVRKEQNVAGLLHDVFKYSLPIMGSSCVLLFYNSINQIIISRYFGVEDFAEFSNGFMPLPFIAIIVNPIRKMLIPMFSKSQKDGTMSETKQFMNRTIYEMGLIIIPMVIFCMCFSKHIMVVLYGEQYASSFVFFIINLLFNYCEIYPMQAILSGLGKTKVLFVFDIIFTVVLLLVNVVLLELSLSSPVIVAVIYTIVQILLRYVTPYIYLRIKGSFNPIKRELIVKMILVTIHVVIVAVATLYLSKLYSGLSILMQLIVSGICFYVVLIGTGLILKLDYISSVKRVIIRK